MLAPPYRSTCMPTVVAKGYNAAEKGPQPKGYMMESSGFFLRRGSEIPFGADVQLL